MTDERRLMLLWSISTTRPWSGPTPDTSIWVIVSVSLTVSCSKVLGSIPKSLPNWGRVRVHLDHLAPGGSLLSPCFKSARPWLWFASGNSGPAHTLFPGLSALLGHSLSSLISYPVCSLLPTPVAFPLYCLPP